MEVLSQAHTLGAIADISFEVVESNFSVSSGMPLHNIIVSRNFAT